MRILEKLRTNWPVLLALVLLPMILYWPFLLGNKALFWGTPLLQFWPWRQFAVDELRAGRLPLWNPYAGCGVPLLADHQTALFYPPNLIYLILPVERAMGVSLYLHAVLAGLAMAVFLRGLGRSRLAAMVGATAFMLSSYLVARGSFLTEVSAIAWLPLLWLYGRRLVLPDKPWQTRLRALLALAAVVALQFLAGHAQTWFYSLISLALYGLWLAGTALFHRSTAGTADHVPSREKDLRGTPLPGALGRFLLLGAAVLWGSALAAIQFLPTLELSRLAQRSADPGWKTFALQYSMWPWRLITLLLPDFFGNPARGNYWGYATYWEDAGYIGVLPFALAVLALLAWLRRRWKRTPQEPHAPEAVPFFSLLALWSLLMALGSNTPVYLWFFRYVPGFSQFQAPARWLGVYTAAMAVLAGVGLDALRPSRALTFVARLALAAALQTALLAWLATTPQANDLLANAGLPDVSPTFAHALLRFSLLAIASLLLLLWQQRHFRSAAQDVGDCFHSADSEQAVTKNARDDRWRWAWPAAVVLLVAGDLLYAGYGLNPAVDAALYARQTEAGAALVADGVQGRLYYAPQAREGILFGRYLDFQDYRSDLQGAERLGFWQGLREALIPDLPTVERLPSANTFEPLVEARYRRLLDALDQVDPQVAQRTLGLMNVAYLFDPDPPSFAEIVYRTPDTAIYRNPDLRPRAYVAHRVQAADSPDHALALLLSPNLDSTTVILETAESPIHQWPNSLPTVPVGPQSAIPNPQLPNPPNQATIQVTLAQPGYLVLMDAYYPGWRVTVDGRAADIERANYAFRAIALEAGTHEVVLIYRPRSWIAGTIVSGTALVALFVTCVVLGWGKE